MTTVSLSPEACLFVANLPSRLGNEELSFRLLEALNEFGRVMFIKTSRDARGRPFGFVQYEKTTAATLAMNNTSRLVIFGRKVRIEKARCLRKFQITIPAEEPTSQKELKEYLERYAEKEDIVFLDVPHKSEQGDEKEETRGEFSIVIKLLDSIDADEVFTQILANYPKWKLSWLNMNVPFSNEAGATDSFSS